MKVGLIWYTSKKENAKRMKKMHVTFNLFENWAQEEAEESKEKKSKEPISCYCGSFLYFGVAQIGFC